MISLQRHHTSRSQNQQPRAKTPLRRKLLVAVDCLLIVFTLVSMTAAGVWAWELTRVVTREEPAASHQVRLQIVNASGQRGIAKLAAKKIDHYSDATIQIGVVGVDEISSTRIDKSFVIARDGNIEPAAAVARRLRMKPEQLTDRALSHNTHQVTATLVLGEDWHTLELPN